MLDAVHLTLSLQHLQLSSCHNDLDWGYSYMMASAKSIVNKEDFLLWDDMPT